MYTREEELKIYQRVGVTEEVYQILRSQKKKQKLSMTKLICNLVLEKYEPLQQVSSK